MTKKQELINELKDMEVLFSKGYMDYQEYDRIVTAINQEIEMEVVN